MPGFQCAHLVYSFSSLCVGYDGGTQGSFDFFFQKEKNESEVLGELVPPFQSFIVRECGLLLNLSNTRPHEVSTIT